MLTGGTMSHYLRENSPKRRKRRRRRLRNRGADRSRSRRLLSIFRS
jgi:hypothetical protein